MLKDIVYAKPLANHCLHLRFEDGVQGEVNISGFVRFTGVFTPLKEQVYFAQVQVNPEIGTICWPNGADLDPDVLYARVSGEPLPDFEREIMAVAEERARYRES
jgi:hypothetical protein